MVRSHELRYWHNSAQGYQIIEQNQNTRGRPKIMELNAQTYVVDEH